MPDDSEQLVVQLEARIRDFERNMQKAEGTGTRSFQRLRKESATATKAMEADMIRSTSRINQALAATSSKIGAWGKGLGTSLAAGALATGVAMLSLSAIIGKTKEALDEFGDIADKSAQSGLDAEFFQGLTYQASLAGVGIDDLSSSLNSFNKSAGLAVVGKGKMVAALQKLNPALLENIRNAKTQEERVRLAADAIDQAKTASEKAALATTLFGDAGAKLVPIFNGGSAAIERTAQKAQELGIIVDRELIARADELGDEFDTATKIMDTQFKQALVDLAPVLTATAELAAQVARAIASIVDSFRDLENQSTRSLNNQMAEIGAKRLDIENKILEAQAAQREEAAKMSATAKNLGFADTQNPALPGGNIDALKAESAELKKQEESILSILTARRKVAEETKAQQNGTGTGDDGDTTLPPITTPGTSSRNTAADDTIKQAEAVKTLIDNLMVERMQVGMSEVEIAKMNALRQAGSAATAEQKAQIEAIIDATYRERTAMDGWRTAISDLKSDTGAFITTFRQGMMAGEGAAASFRTAISNMANSIATRLEQLAANKLIDLLLGTAVSGSSFPAAPSPGLGGVIGFHADGTEFAPGGPSVVGERGPELVHMPRGAQVIPNHRLPQGGGQDVTVTIDMKADGQWTTHVKQQSRAAAAQTVGQHVPRMIHDGIQMYRAGPMAQDARKAMAKPSRMTLSGGGVSMPRKR